MVVVTYKTFDSPSEMDFGPKMDGYERKLEGVGGRGMLQRERERERERGRECTTLEFILLIILR